MNDVATIIADLVKAGTDPDLVGRVAAAIAGVRQVDEQAERRRAADRARKAACKAGIPQNSAESADKRGFDKEIPHTPLEITSPKVKTPSRARPAIDLPADWQPDPKTWALADELGFTSQEVSDQLERMRDWAKNAGGGKGQKSDWDAAFRNWIKRAADDHKSSPKATQRHSIHTTLDAIDAVADEAIRRSGGHWPEGGKKDTHLVPRLRQGTA